MRMFVCSYVCMCLCAYFRMCAYVCMCVCVYVRMYVCVYVCMCVLVHGVSKILKNLTRLWDVNTKST